MAHRNHTAHIAEEQQRREESDARWRLRIARETPPIDPCFLLDLFQCEAGTAWALLATLDDEQLYHQASAVASHLARIYDNVDTDWVLSDWQRYFAQSETPEDEEAALLEAAQRLATHSVEDSQHYRKVAHYLRIGSISMIDSLDGSFSIQHQRNSIHFVTLDADLSQPGIARHSCTCPAQRCWARALADVIVAVRNEEDDADSEHTDQVATLRRVWQVWQEGQVD